MDSMAQITHAQVVRYVANKVFNKAVLFFEDRSHLQFEHTSRQNRWAKASSSPSEADKICQSLKQFRLNAKHLQLYFVDDSDVEFSEPGLL